jgi:hypothetical protein
MEDLLSQPVERSAWQRWWPFAALLAAAASRWMLVGARPETESTLLSQTFGCAWAAGLCLAILGLRRSRETPRNTAPPLPWRQWGLGLAAGALLLAGPWLGMLLHDPQLDPSGLSMALALTPVVVATALAALAREQRESVSGRLWPGLAAVAGLLLVLAQPNLGYAKDDAIFLLAPVCSGFGAALFFAHRPPEGRAARGRAAAALLGASAVFAMGWAATQMIFGPAPSPSLAAIACDGILALLSVLSLYRLGATRWAAQFTLVPLLILLEGIVLVRPGFTTRWIVGLGLLMLASLYLLLPQAAD